jgi:hypothetical protein
VGLILSTLLAGVIAGIPMPPERHAASRIRGLVAAVHSTRARQRPVESKNSERRRPKSGRFPRLGLFSIGPFLNGTRGAGSQLGRVPKPQGRPPPRWGAQAAAVGRAAAHPAVSPHRVPYGRPFGHLLVILTAELSSHVPIGPI